MRRLIGYSLISITTFLLIGLNALSVLGRLNANLEFASGREMVFRLTDKTDEAFVFEDDSIALDVAQTMIQRLENASSTKYNVFVEGQDHIRVQVSETRDIRYTRLSRYLAFDADFTLATTTDVLATNEQLFEGMTARVEYRGQTPFVVIPLKDPTLVKEVLLTEATGGDSDDAELLLWAGKLETDNFRDSLNDAQMRERIVLRFNVSTMWWDEEQTELASAIPPSRYGSANPNNVFEPAAVTQANEEAIFYRNLFNASVLPVNVELLFSTPIAPAAEPILQLGEILTLAPSATLLASSVALILVFAVLIYFYKFSSLGVLATSGLSLLTSVFAYISLGLLFSSAALLGFFTVGALALFISISYLSAFRREVYAGRSLKKAHVEASSVLLPLAIDTTVVTLVFGLLLYIFAGNLVQNFAVFIMFGAVSNLLIVYGGNRLLYGLLASDHVVANNLKLIAINKQIIPNIMKEEKPVYFGRFAGRDFTSKGKLMAPLTLGFGVLSIVATFTLGALSIPPIQPPATQVASRLYVEVKDFSQFESTADIEEKLLDNILVNDEELMLASPITVHDFFRVEDEVNVDYRLYVINLANVLEETNVFTFILDDFSTETFNELLEYVAYVYYEDEQISSIGFYDIQPVTNQPTVTEIAFGAILALLFTTLYVLLRLSVAKALTTLFLALNISFISLGFFVATRIGSSSILTMHMLPIALLSVVFILAIFAQASEAQRKAKRQDSTVDDIVLGLRKATSLSLTPIFLSLSVPFYVGLSFFTLGPSLMQGLYAALLLGGLLTAFFVSALVPDLFRPFYLLFKGFNIWILRPKFKKAKLASASVVRSNEPQEATYIGIND